MHFGKLPFPRLTRSCHGTVPALAVVHAQRQTAGVGEALHKRGRARLPQAQALEVLGRHACSARRSGHHAAAVISYYFISNLSLT